MLLLLLACAVEPDAPDAAVEPVTDAPSSSERIVLGAAIDVADPMVVELDGNGQRVWEFHVKELFGSEWDAMPLKPLLMAVQPVEGGTFLLSLYGVGLLEIDHEGTVVWRLDDSEASHDVDRLPNGNTLYTRTWAAQGEVAVVEVDRSGNTVWSWSGADEFGHNPLFDGYEDEQHGWMHATAVHRFDDGRTSVCMRNFNEVVVLGASGGVDREVSFAAPTGSPGPRTTGNLQGLRPHAAEWVPGLGLSIALRSPDRALLLKDGTIVHELRNDDISGITDVDVAADGSMLIAAHDRVVQTNASGGVVWSWVVQADDTASGSDRARHVFNTVSRVGADGAPLDFD